MPQNCPIGLGITVCCPLDCSQWHRGFGYCTVKFNSWQDSVTQSVTQPQQAPDYRVVDRLRAEINHLTNKLNEHVDISKRRKGIESKPKATSGGFVIGNNP